MPKSSEVLALEGALTVDRASNLRSRLLEVLAESQEVTLDFSRASTVDLSFVQVLYAASREAAAAGKKISFAGTLPEEIGAMLEIGGFCRKAPEDSSRLSSALFDFSAGAAL